MSSSQPEGRAPADAEVAPDRAAGPAEGAASASPGDSFPVLVREARTALRDAWRRLREQSREHRAALPSLHALVDELHDAVGESTSVGVIVLALRNLEEIEDAHGWGVADALLLAAADAAGDAVGTVLPAGAWVASAGMFGEDVLAFVPLPADASSPADSVARQADELERHVQAHVAERRVGDGWDLRLASGWSILAPRAGVRFERLVGRALVRAHAMLADLDQRQRARRRAEMTRLLADRSFRVAYQPIVDLTTLRIFGHEALCRGPATGAFAVAESLFAASYEFGLAVEVDGACRETILAQPVGLPRGSKLFLNVLPDSLLADRVPAADVLAGLAALGLQPGDLVLEIAERGHVQDYARFRKALAPFREAGVAVALDDIGAGYASLRLVPEIEPDFLKVDIALVQGIDREPIKRGVLDTIVDLGRRLAARVIGEGIETEGELAAVRAAGVDLGQGFLLASPAAAPVDALPDDAQA